MAEQKGKAKAPPWVKDPPKVEPVAEPQPAIKMIVEQVKIKPLPKEEIAQEPVKTELKVEPVVEPVTPAVPIPVMEAKPFSWRRAMRLFFARIKYWLWQILAKGILGLIYIAVISEGLRLLVPALGQKVYKLPIPGAYMLEDDEVGHRLDLAHGFAIFLLLGVFYLWAELLKFWLRPGEESDEGWDSDNYRRLITALGIVILGADGCLFYFSVSQMDWSGGQFSVTALLATVAYLAVLVLASFTSLKLSQKVIDLSEAT
jgi:hypothetical protein